VSPARFFKVENRLAKLARAGGGKTVEEAVRSAESRVASVRERCVGALAGKADQLAAYAAAARGERSGKNIDALYDLSNAIFGVAGSYGLEALAEAAYSLCDLVDRLRSGEALNRSAIDVHVDGIRLLATGDTAVSETILAGLRRVRERFAPPT
jgi:hypothetical protein